jgi:hypothetical protein
MRQEPVRSERPRRDARADDRRPRRESRDDAPDDGWNGPLPEFLKATIGG